MRSYLWGVYYKLRYPMFGLNIYGEHARYPWWKQVWWAIKP